MLPGEHHAMEWPDVRLLPAWRSLMLRVINPAGVWSQEQCSRPCLSKFRP